MGRRSLYIVGVIIWESIKMKKKALSLVLAMSMVFSVVPTTTVNATEITAVEETETVEESIQETQEQSETETSSVEETTATETSITETIATEVATKETEVEENTTTEDSTESKEKITDNGTDGELRISASAKMVGSDGVEYDDVSYLSASNVLAMSADNQKAYKEICDDIAQIKADGMGIENIVISVDEKGILGYSYYVPFSEVADQQMKMYGIDESEVEVISLDELEEKLTETATEETTTEETSVEEATVEETTTEDASVEEATVEETATEEASAEEMTQLDIIDVGAANAVFAENVSLAQANAIDEEYIGDEFQGIEAILPATTYFKNQLDGVGLAIYNAGLQSMVYGGSNQVHAYIPAMNSSSISTGLSALILTYPAKFDWKDENGGWNGRYYYRGGQYEINLSIIKSSYYSASLEKAAQAKVSELKAKAYAYAKSSYPNNQAYGMVKYFDAWMCANNYYNKAGMGSASSATHYYCHSSYGALLKGYGVCESFALAQSRLLDAVGIPNVYVVGYAYGKTSNGHAWNYVQMPDNKWYMLDSTWNNPSTSANNASQGSTGMYLLSKKDKDHTPTGKEYLSSNKLNFPSLAKENYKPANVALLKTNSLVLKVGKSAGILNNSKYYREFNKSFVSSNTKVATVDKKGVVKAKGVGEATVTATVGAVTSQVKVKVYNIKSIKFEANSKSEYSYKYADPDGKIDGSDAFTLKINVNQADGTPFTAADLVNSGLKAPKVSTSNKKVATATASMSGNAILLRVQPVSLGSAELTVSFAGKKAKLKLGVKQKIQTAWFTGLEYTSKEYAAKALKPKVKKTEAAPKNLTYKVKYKNNKNVGTATVTITGTGKYAGDVNKTFTITKANISGYKTSLGKKSASFAGKAIGTSATVKKGDRVLKYSSKPEKTDFVITYNGSANKPVNVGEYKVSIVGSNNYTGTIANIGTFTIKQVSASKLKISCPETVKYTGSNLSPVKAVKIGDNAVAASNYTLKYYLASDKSLTKAVTPNAKGKYVAVVYPKGNNIDTSKKKYVKKAFTVK